MQPQTRSTAVAGLEWCTSLADEIALRLDEIPLLEIIPDNFFCGAGVVVPSQLAREIERRGIPVMVHAINLSLASIEELPAAYLERVLEVVRALPTTIGLSDHLCMTQKDGFAIGQLTPTPYSAEVLDAVVRKIDAIEKVTGLPFAFENISHPFFIEGEMSETEFITALFARSDANLLLDLHNLYTNGVNFGVDPYGWVGDIDLARVDSIHLAGGFYDEDHMLQDGHCAKVPEPVWRLYAHVLREARRPLATVIERTGRNSEHGLRPVLEDQERAQRMLDLTTSPLRATSNDRFASNPILVGAEPS